MRQRAGCRAANARHRVNSSPAAAVLLTRIFLSCVFPDKLKSLTNKLKATETAEKLVENYMDHKDSNLHRSVIETIMRANQKIFREVNGMSDIFMEIVQEKFDRKLKEEVEKATEEYTVKVAVKTKLTERISLIQKKCSKNKPLSVIADELETDVDEILSLYDIISKNPVKTTDEIYQTVAG